MSDGNRRLQRAISLPADLGLLTLLGVGIDVFEHLIAKESGPFDTVVLWFIRQNILPATTGFFTLVTLTGAAIFLVSATVLSTAIFLTLMHQREALLLASSMACAGLHRRLRTIG